MKTKLQKCIYLSILFILSGNCTYALTNFAKATIAVFDENNKPVEGAYTGITFETNTSQGPKFSTGDGLTDSVGKFTASGNCNGHIAYGAKKEGYYDSYNIYDFKGKNSFGWEPWNPELKIVLRKIENPVQMYARDTKRSKIEIPIVNQDVGFDLVKFDWVVPYGIGSNADFIFNLQRLPVVSRKNYDATLTITFSNKWDGIQAVREDLQYGSKFKLPRFAPENGYESKLILHQWRVAGGPVNQNFDFKADDLNYVFRVRSVHKDGKIERSMYGKTRGYISFTAMESKTAKIYFTYYLNPDYTRNLEFDPKRNLFGNLPDLERVTEP